MYGALILITEPENNMGILMFWLCVMTLYARGYYNQKKKLKEVITVVIFCGLILSELRFGTACFFTNLLEKIGYTFVYFMSLLFFQLYITDKIEIMEDDKKLDLQNYSELKKT